MVSSLMDSGRPLMPLQIDSAVWTERNALFPEPRFLLIEKRGKPPRMIDHPVTGIVSVVFRHAQNLPHEPRIPVPSDQPGNLAVCGDPAPGDFCNDREDFINQTFIQSHPQGSFPALRFVFSVRHAGLPADKGSISQIPVSRKRPAPWRKDSAQRLQNVYGRARRSEWERRARKPVNGRCFRNSGCLQWRPRRRRKARRHPAGAFQRRNPEDRHTQTPHCPSAKWSAPCRLARYAF